jgi:hypothetical protein
MVDLVCNVLTWLLGRPGYRVITNLNAIQDADKFIRDFDSGIVAATLAATEVDDPVDPDVHVCPECLGVGERRMVPLVAVRRDGTLSMTEDEAKRMIKELSRCRLCDATGSVSTERLSWRERGDRMRQDRLALHVGLREYAEKIGMLPSEYSAMECGYVKPDLSLSADIMRAKGKI